MLLLVSYLCPLTKTYLLTIRKVRAEIVEGMRDSLDATRKGRMYGRSSDLYNRWFGFKFCVFVESLAFKLDREFVLFLKR